MIGEHGKHGWIDDTRIDRGQVLVDLNHRIRSDRPSGDDATSMRRRVGSALRGHQGTQSPRIWGSSAFTGPLGWHDRPKPQSRVELV